MRGSPLPRLQGDDLLMDLCIYVSFRHPVSEVAFEITARTDSSLVTPPSSQSPPYIILLIRGKRGFKSRSRTWPRSSEADPGISVSRSRLTADGDCSKPRKASRGSPCKNKSALSRIAAWSFGYLHSNPCLSGVLNVIDLFREVRFQPVIQ
jgi:hypothetical protein